VTSVHLIASSDIFKATIEKAFEDSAPVILTEIAITGFDADAVQSVIEDDPDLVVVGPDLSDDDALKIIEEIGRRAPHISSIMVANPTAELWPEALRAGVRDVLKPLVGPGLVRDSFERAIETGRRIRGLVTEALPETPEHGRIVVIVSPKGGSGKTTVASNLAATVARHHPDDVVLVDLDVQFGDVVHAFRLEPEYSLLNATTPGVTPTVLKGFLTPHSSRVLALAAPDRPEDADDVDPAAATEAIRTLATLFGSVVVDTAAGLDERTLSVLDVATDVVFVSATDVPSVRAIVKELDILERLGLLADRRRHLVLNRADARVGLSASDIEETIGLSASLSISSSRSIPTALNLGEPLVVGDERGTIARGFTKFAESLDLIPNRQESGRGWRLGR
jgi:pilus assembly protein CpaE